MQIGVLVSGSGSNLQALLDKCKDGFIRGNVAVVVSDKKEAGGLKRAKKHGAEAIYLEPPKGMLAYTPGEGITIEDVMNDSKRQEYDSDIVSVLEKHDVSCVCLAGYMKLITPVFINAFPDKVINIHPSLLPSHKGTHGVGNTLDYGNKVAGCSTHIVDTTLDSGPIILQAPTPIFPGDNENTLKERNLKREWVTYPETVKLFCEDNLKVVDNGCRRVVEILDEEHVIRFNKKLMHLNEEDFLKYSEQWHHVRIIAGSENDSHIINRVVSVLEDKVSYEVNIASAHREPEKVKSLVKTSHADAYICIAGKSAALPGFVASYSKKPVIGVPVSASLGGLDALLSIAQMPKGVPVATVGIDSGENAAYLALRILGVNH